MTVFTGSLLTKVFLTLQLPNFISETSFIVSFCYQKITLPSAPPGGSLLLTFFTVLLLPNVFLKLQLPNFISETSFMVSFCYQKITPLAHPLGVVYS